MQNEPNSASQALEICRIRSMNAIDLLKQGNLSEGMQALKKQKSAFCNFRYYVADFNVDERLRKEVLFLNDVLEDLVDKAMKDLTLRKSRLSHGRGVIEKFQSSSQNVGSFQRSV